MTLNIEINPETEQRLQRDAEDQGVTLPDLAASILEKYVTREKPKTGHATEPMLEESKCLPLAERARAFRAWADGHTGVPVLSAEAMRRENIYGNRA